MSFVSMGLLLVGLLACFVGLFVTMSIQMLAGLHLRWQIYNEYLLEGGAPIELAPWEKCPRKHRSPSATRCRPRATGWARCLFELLELLEVRLRSRVGRVEGRGLFERPPGQRP